MQFEALVCVLVCLILCVFACLFVSLVGHVRAHSDVFVTPWMSLHVLVAFVESLGSISGILGADCCLVLLVHSSGGLGAYF